MTLFVAHRQCSNNHNICFKEWKMEDIGAVKKLIKNTTSIRIMFLIGVGKLSKKAVKSLSTSHCMTYYNSVMMIY